MTTLVFRHACIIMDASSVISLYASRRIEEIVEVVPVRMAISEYVYLVEALTVHPDPAVGEVAPEQIDLESLIMIGKLRIEPLKPGAEEITMVNFAAGLGDDGEAHTGAIASNRDWAIAIDDRRAASFFRQETPHLQLITTPELVKHWVESASPQTQEVRNVLRDIRIRGRYSISRHHTLYHWWQANS